MEHPRTVLVINQDQMGHGDRALGQKVLGTFFKKCIALHGLDSVLFFNGGAKLLAADSPVRAELSALEQNGIDLLGCGTCLEHFGVEVAVGTVSGMEEIVAQMAKAEKVITL